mmetsp:Transcript_8288/g.10902  ORF Transcript_8288/g.10902 Transcript_8288/m.10902 type:complete len:734 (+) Transcript_8288:154-2355(+)
MVKKTKKENGIRRVSLDGDAPLHKGGSEIKLFVGSFNMGNAEIENIGEWIPAKGGEYDIIALGMQESTFKPLTCATDNGSSRLPVEGEKEGSDRKLQHQRSYSAVTPKNIEAVQQQLPKRSKPSRPDAGDGKDRAQHPVNPDGSDSFPDREDSLEVSNAGSASSQRSILDSIVAIFQPDCDCVSQVESVTNGDPNSSRAQNDLGTPEELSDFEEEQLINDSNAKSPYERRPSDASSDMSYDPYEDETTMDSSPMTFLDRSSENLKDATARLSKSSRRYSGGIGKDRNGYSRLKQILNDHLGEDFRCIGKNRRGQMQLRIYIRRSLAKEVRHVETDAENTGLGHVMANKGGLVCKFSILDTTVCFVSCHLQAHEGAKNMKARNSSCAEILGGTRVGNKQFDLSTQFHHVFWFGDMNYRTDFQEDNADWDKQWHQAKDLVDQQKYEELYKWDELHREIEKGNCLWGFQTTRPNFAPTFKVARHKLLEYNPKRIPSYTDRILWKSLPGLCDLIKQDSFEGCFGCDSSDHKPVRATFSVVPTPVDIDKRLLNHTKGQITFTNLRGTDLEAMDLEVAGGKSDPYIVFYSDPKDLLHHSLPRQPRTKTVKRTVNPSWEGHSYDLQLNSNNLTTLMHSHILLMVMDKDFLNPDDLIGVCVLPIRALFESSARIEEGKRVYDFTLPVQKKGLIHGKISGTITYSSEKPRRRASHALSFSMFKSSKNKEEGSPSCCNKCAVS